MDETRFNNAPLIEAIFELKWQLPNLRNNLPVDDNYPIIIGALNEKFKAKYPIHEPLPTLAIPEEMAKWNVQHRFRSKESGWPLYQIGPGIITLNFTKEYSPSIFCKSLNEFIKGFYEIYPDIERLVISELSLRYIDALEFNYQNSILEYLNSELDIGITISKELFATSLFNEIPDSIDVRFSYPIVEDVGKFNLRLARGSVNSADGIIIESVVSSDVLNKTLNSDEIIQWAKKAHDVTHTSFKIIFAKIIERGDFN